MQVHSYIYSKALLTSPVKKLLAAAYTSALWSQLPVSHTWQALRWGTCLVRGGLETGQKEREDCVCMTSLHTNNKTASTCTKSWAIHSASLPLHTAHELVQRRESLLLYATQWRFFLTDLKHCRLEAVKIKHVSGDSEFKSFPTQKVCNPLTCLTNLLQSSLNAREERSMYTDSLQSFPRDEVLRDYALSIKPYEAEASRLWHQPWL